MQWVRKLYSARRITSRHAGHKTRCRCDTGHVNRIMETRVRRRAFRGDPATSEIERLKNIMNRLRDPGGCPWDREQTPSMLATYLLEETYEVLDAIESGSPGALKEELGDLLLQIVFHARIAQETGEFDLDDVIKEIADKIVRRHPHVFGEDRLSTADQVLTQWEEIKAVERKNRRNRSMFASVPATLPALLKALRISSKAARVGFDWSDHEGLFEKIEEETGELRDALRSGRQVEIEDEIGDLLFTLVNLARRLEIDPEVALQRANRKFIARFQYVEERLRAKGLSLSRENRDRMEILWAEAKRFLRKTSSARRSPSDGTSGIALRPGRRGTGSSTRRASGSGSRRGAPPAASDRSGPRRKARARSRR